MILADVDTSFLLPCKRCSELLTEGQRFCPLCGQDQSVIEDAGLVAAYAGADFPASAPGEMTSTFDWTNTEKPKPSRTFGLALRPGGGRENPGRESDFVFPDVHHLAESAGVGRFAIPPHLLQRSVLILIAALVVLFLSALLYDHFYANRQANGALAQQVRASVEPVRSALARGDLGVAGQALENLEAEHPNDAAVREAREAFDRQAREQAARQAPAKEALADASAETDRAEKNRPGTEPSAARQSEAPAAIAPTPSKVVPPTPDSAPSRDKPCSQALAALALCQ